MSGIEERIGEVVEHHRETFDRETERRECSCGNWTEESFDDAGGYLTHAGHVAEMLVTELGLTQEWAASGDWRDGRVYSVIEGSRGSRERAKHHCYHDGIDLITRYATDWERA